MSFQTKQMLKKKKKARPGKHGDHPTILSRWHACDEYRKSLSDLGWREHHIILYDRIALEKNVYIATRAERMQHLKHRNLTANCRRRNSAITQSTTRLSSSEKRMQTIARRAPGNNPSRIQRHSSQSTNKTAKGEQFEGNEEYDYAFDPYTGWRLYRQSRGNLQTSASGSRDNLQATSSSSSTCEQAQWKMSIWNSQHSPSPDDW